jgi:hypothetical protein
VAGLIEVGECPVHGLVTPTRIGMIGRPEITTGPLCTVCYIEFVKEKVVVLQNVRLIEITQ